MTKVRIVYMRSVLVMSGANDEESVSDCHRNDA